MPHAQLQSPMLGAWQDVRALLGQRLAAFLERDDVTMGAKVCALALWAEAGCRRGVVTLRSTDLAGMVGGDERSARRWLPELLKAGILEKVERSSARWTVAVDLSVGTPTLGLVAGAAQGVLFDPFATEGDEAAGSADPAVFAFGGPEPGQNAGQNAGKMSGTEVAKDPLKLKLNSIRIPDPDSAQSIPLGLTGGGQNAGKMSGTPPRAHGPAAQIPAAKGPESIGDVLGSGAFAQSLIELNDPARWAEVVRKFEGEVDRLVPWPLQAASRTRIAELLADGDLTRAELLRTVDATKRYERADTLRGAPGSDPADWPGASVVRLVQRKLDDKGREHLWWRGKGSRRAEGPR